MTGSSELIRANGLASGPIQAQEVLESIPRELKVVSLYLALIARRSSFKKLVNDVYLFMKDRYFIGEVLEACLEGKSWYNCTILQVRAPTEQEILDYQNSSEGSAEDDQIFPPACLYHYQVEKFCSYNDISRVFEAGASHVRRKKRLITKGKLNLFLKQCLTLNATGIWIVQETIQQSFGIASVKFSDIFVGQPPTFPTRYEKIAKRIKKDPSVNVTGHNENTGIVAKKEGAKKIKQAKKTSRDVNCSASSNEDSNADDFKNNTRLVTDTHSTVGTHKISSRKSSKSEASHPTKAVKKVKKKYGKQESEKQNVENPVKRKYATWRGLTWEERQKIKEKKKKRALLERLKKQEEKLRERAKREAEKRQMKKDRNSLIEDLECEDLKAMPIPQEVKCSHIPNELFGDFMFVLEFFQYFRTLVSLGSFFSRGITFNHLESALTDQNIEGHLSNIVIMLLTALFKMQDEDSDALEADTSAIDVDGDHLTDGSEAAEAVRLAAAECSRRLYHGAFATEMSLNHLTVTEVLRLHFVSCGGGRGELSSNNRRNALADPGDPVTMLRIKHPQILRDLSIIHVCEMPMQEKINILSCLIDQVLECHAVREEIDERGEQLKQWKLDIRAYKAAEVKRKKEAYAQRNKEKLEAKQKLKEGEVTQLNSTIPVATPDVQDKSEAENCNVGKQLRSYERKKAEIQEKIGKLRTLTMNYQMSPLGTDRAHRRFWVFSSLPGLYVEHNPYEIGPCLPPRKVPSPHNSHIVKDPKSPIRKHQSPTKKEFSNEVSKNSDTEDIVSSAAEPACSESWLCTSSGACLVHGHSLPRRQWSYFAQKDDILHLIESLNKSGVRENELRRTLLREEQWLKEVIDQCPINLLNPPCPTENKPKSTSSSSKYRHLNCPPDASANVLMELVLRERILHLESRISGRCMGSLDVKDIEMWRGAIKNGHYDRQCERLEWGFCSDQTDISESGTSSGEEKNSTKTANDQVVVVNGSNVFAQNNIQDTLASGCTEPKKMLPNKSRESLSGRVLEEKNGENCRAAFHESELKSPEDLEKENIGVIAIAKDNQSKSCTIKNLASAILQLAQSVDERYLRNPLTDEEDEDQKIIQLKRWEIALMNSMGFSQLLLHVSLLDSSIHWSKSVLNTCCAICRKRGDGEKMLLCDGCNRGHHLYCLKPKLRNVPKGDWFCSKCVPEDKRDLLERDRKRKSIDSENVTREYEKRPSKSRKIVHNDICEGCGLRYNLILCSSCPLAFHTVCVNPPLQEPPEGVWTCHECSSHGSGSAIEEKENETTSRRSSRRKSGTTDGLLNNSLLQDLLSDIMCQKDAWPFLQPVRKAEAPRYHIIVKKPMDLGTMKYKLNRAQYKNNSEFLADALLVFENCRMYNEDNADVFKCGSRLSQYFKKRCKDLGLDIRD